MSLHATKGIVFHHFKYGETSIIAKIYTEKFGLQTYLVKGLRSKKSTLRMGLFEPGSLVDMIVYKNEKSSLQFIREIKCDHPYATVPFDIRKSAVLLFITEVLTKAIREEMADPGLFGFIRTSLITLDETEPFSGNFHLVFMIRLTRFLGFFPVYDLSDSRPCFNLEEGRFQAFGILPGYSIDPPLSTLFGEFLHADYTSAGSIRISASTRNELLDKIIRYYMIHLPLIKEIRSHHVLREVCFESDQAGKMST